MADMLTLIDRQLAFIPDWAISLVVVLLFGLAGLAAHRLLYRFLKRITANSSLFWRSLVGRAERPARLAMFAMALSLGASVAPLTNGQANAMRQVLMICVIILIAWAARIAMHIWSVVYLRRFQLDHEDNLLARKHVTQFGIFQRIIDLAIVIVAVSAVLMTFDQVRQYGVSLLASAGAAGLVLGLALQPVLKNLLAGVQLAVTQPIRIGDALIVEGEWGNVEEITSTYVVLKLWDWRRLILPLNYFIEKPFQNWTRESASLIGTVMIYLDYRAPIDAIRSKVEEIVKSSRLHDGQVINVAVTDFKEQAMELRILVSSSNAPRTFDLRTEVREKLIGFLQTHHPQALPRVRLEQETVTRRAATAIAE
ncbi:mechanosensitive ion channel family protein [Rhizobium sp.]